MGDPRWDEGRSQGILPFSASGYVLSSGLISSLILAPAKGQLLTLYIINFLVLCSPGGWKQLSNLCHFLELFNSFVILNPSVEIPGMSSIFLPKLKKIYI